MNCQNRLIFLKKNKTDEKMQVRIEVNGHDFSVRDARDRCNKGRSIEPIKPKGEESRLIQSEVRRAWGNVV